jgi:hypothetical protein
MDFPHGGHWGIFNVYWFWPAMVVSEGGAKSIWIDYPYYNMTSCSLGAIPTSPFGLGRRDVRFI